MARNIQQIIEKQMSFWRIQSKTQETIVKERFMPANMIALSNAYGSNGVEIAHRVGEMLGIPTYDREIVEHIATTSKVRTETVETLDQVVQGQIEDYIAARFRERKFDQSDYLLALTRTIMALWGHGSCVMIGRGASHIVYRKHALAVRIVAATPYRLEFVQKLLDVAEAEARRRMERMDSERAAFIRRMFNENIDDPLAYDLVINRTGMTDDDCAALIVDAFLRKLGGVKR